MRRQSALLATAAALLVVADTTPAEAKCTRLAFSVNDYGKEGPIRDAKALLDKYIADHMAKMGVKKYTVGKKDVTCELFLDFGFFDEHTCKASALVCWGDAAPAKAATPADGAAPAATPPAAKPAAQPAAAPKAAPASGQPKAPSARPAPAPKKDGT